MSVWFRGPLIGVKIIHVLYIYIRCSIEVRVITVFLATRQNPTTPHYPVQPHKGQS